MTWSTLLEIHNDYYSVQRSEDGIIWETFAIIPGAGFASNGKDYEAVDVSPIPGMVNYRIKQSDIFGGIHFTSVHIIHFDEKSDSLDLTMDIYPNPSSGQFNVRIDNAQAGSFRIILMDYTGRNVHTESIDSDHGQTAHSFWPGDNVRAGTYNIAIFREDELLAQQMIMVQ